MPGLPGFYFAFRVVDSHLCVPLKAPHISVYLEIFSLCLAFIFWAVTLVWVSWQRCLLRIWVVSFAGPRFLFWFVASFRRVGFDTRLSNPVCGLASICCLLGRLCVKMLKLIASHFFTGWALVVKLVVSDRSYIGLFSCACFYITR